MKPVKKAVLTSLIVSLLFTFGLLCGIPAIVLGAVYGITAVFAIGIVCTVLGFYGIPVSWSIYSNKRGLMRLVSAIVEENIYNVNELAEHLTLSYGEVKSRLSLCFARKYLAGYRREGDNIVLNEGVALGKKQYGAECPNCGAKFTYTAGNARCPYCNTPVGREKTEN